MRGDLKRLLDSPVVEEIIGVGGDEYVSGFERQRKIQRLPACFLVHLSDLRDIYPVIIIP